MELHVSKITMPEKETHYRYCDYHFENGIKVELRKFYSVRETECFHYVINEWDFKLMQKWDMEKLSNCKYTFVTVKKVMKGALRTYCNEDKDLALKSFEKRKLSQLFHAQTSISKATLSLRKIASMSANDVGDSVYCGIDDHLQSFVFD